MREYKAPVSRRDGGDRLKNGASNLVNQRPDRLRQWSDSVLLYERKKDIEPIVVVHELTVKILCEKATDCVLSDARRTNDVNNGFGKHVAHYNEATRTYTCPVAFILTAIDAVDGSSTGT
jgi:hypothetical protein